MSRSLLEKLQSLEASVRGTEPQLNVVPHLAKEVPDRHNRAESVPSDVNHEEHHHAGFESVSTPYGTCLRRQTTFDLFTYHGKHQFADILHVELGKIASLLDEDIVSPVDFRFYDVETNGLGTGAGTFPFLHTVGYIEHDELCLMQYFIDDYGAEKAVLHCLSEEHFSNDRTIVVTFNGKSFDWPLLQNRRIMHQLPKLEFLHLDLLHPSRRLWRKQLGRVKLTDLEMHVLGLERTDDLPGSEAPERYFAYLDHRDIGVVEPVFSHNAMDVCSLVVLVSEIADFLNGRYTKLPSATHLALASWYEAWHELHFASMSYEAAARAEDADWRAKWLFSMHIKRRGDLEQACEIWRDLARQYDARIEPLIELAKCYEHKLRQLQYAEDMVLEAISRLRRGVGALLSIPHRVDTADEEREISPLEAALLHRLGRIRTKQQR